jgi:cupin 2 domain-containing protein
MINNFYKYNEQFLKDEIFEDILKSKEFRIERIISNGQSTPDGEWYDQEQNEWVILLKGSACLTLENNDKIVLNEGDYINLPAHFKHRVEWTDKNQTSIWLAIHYI